MARETFLQLARQSLRMPIGVDLVLHRHEDFEAILLDGVSAG